MKAVIYVRVSTEEQAKEGISLEAQEAKCRAYADLRELEVVEVIREEGVSGTRPLARRPGGERLLGLVRHGKVRAIIAMRLDRCFRDDEFDGIRFVKAWGKRGVSLHLVDEGGCSVNTSTAFGWGFLAFMLTHAGLTPKLISERTSTCLAHMKARKQVYSRDVFGWDVAEGALVENPEELSWVEQMRDWREEGWTLRAIAEELNAEGVPTKRGGRWYASTVRQILGNSLYSTTTCG